MLKLGFTTNKTSIQPTLCLALKYASEKYVGKWGKEVNP